MSGRRILVTGSTRGIGHAIAKRFLAEGETVFIHGQSPEAIQMAVSELRADFPEVQGLAGDLADRRRIREIATEVGTLDVLVNNAGFYVEETAEQVAPESWDRMMAVNVSAAWFLTKACLPGLRKRQGAIINIASDAAFVGIPGGTSYCASKGAMVGLTRALAIELMPDVRVLCICPGPVETDMMRNQMASAADPDAMRDQWMSFAPLNRVAKPEEIAALVTFAAKPESSFATGAAWLIDGGQTAGKRLG